MKARIGGVMVLLMVAILAVSGMFWGSGTDGFDEPFQVVGKAQSLERMNIIQGTLLVNGQARNGVEATLWRAEAFDSPPAFGDPEPEDIRFRIGNPVVTGREYGGDGAYRFVSIPDGDYYVGLEVEASIAWEGHSTQRGLSTSRLRTQVHEYSRVASGQTLTLADVKGSGVVRQIFVAISSEAKSVVEDGTWLRVYVNGETNPSIACPISQFFAYTHEAEPFHSARIGTSRKSYPGDPGVDGNHSTFDRGAYRYIDIPFGSEVRIDLDVGADDWMRAWSVVYYEETPIPFSYGRRNRLVSNYVSANNVPPYDAVEVLNIEGRGSLDNMVISGRSPDGHQVLEGNLEIFVDGEFEPSIYVSGVEDITGNAFYFGFDQLVGPYQGTTVHHSGLPVRWTQYRFFDHDRIDFDRSLRVTINAGHKGQGAILATPVDLQATLFYYLDTPIDEGPELALDLVVHEEFETFADGEEISIPWVQWGGSSRWLKGPHGAAFDDADADNDGSSRDAWMYYTGSARWPDQVVEADVRVDNFGRGEAWIFARGSDSPVFNERVTFGFSAVGAEPDGPNYQPVMLFIASGAYSESSLLRAPANQVHTLRLEVDGDVVIASLRREGDRDFRELFRHSQTARLIGVSGISEVNGQVSVEGFRIYTRSSGPDDGSS